MSIFRRRPTIQAPPDLEPGERVVASARTADGGVLAVTNHRLVVEGDHPLRVAWHLVDGGGWRPEGDELWASFVDGTGPGAWVLPEPGSVPMAFRERVQGSVVLTEHVVIDRVNAARVVLRKDPRDSRLSVQTIFRQGADPELPPLRQGIADAVARLAEHVGLER